MDIKFKDLQRIEGESKGKVWTAYKVIGTKLEDGSDWESTNVFDNQYNSDLLEELRGLEAGQKVAIKHTKNKRGYWTVSGIGEVSDKPANPPQRKSAGGTASGGRKGSTKTSSDAMSKEEWAAKNAVDALRIAKSVALKAAVENTLAHTPADKIVEMAQQFMPFLIDDKMPDDVPSATGGEDGLDAPDV